VPASGQPAADYSWTDIAVPAGTHFYRIIANGLNGNKYYSSIVKVAVEGALQKSAVIIYPNNIAGNTLHLQLNGLSNEMYSIEIFNSTGQLVHRQNLNHAGSNITYSLSLPDKMPAGKYQLRLNGNSFHSTTGFIKQ
ncbi:MAG TPA: T9SS type A sorting domain-containing protein, partial [Ferruginibacter sp.]|nr:T9SS type A sorting domain-containing protein [Ferruginibacter sp.]